VKRPAIDGLNLILWKTIAGSVGQVLRGNFKACR
jgi:hypothetical protein